MTSGRVGPKTSSLEPHRKKYRANAAVSCGFFFNDTATTEIYTLSLHDALPILSAATLTDIHGTRMSQSMSPCLTRSEEHTSELQSRVDLVCCLLLEKKKEHVPAPAEGEAKVVAIALRAVGTRLKVDTSVCAPGSCIFFF